MCAISARHARSGGETSETAVAAIIVTYINRVIGWRDKTTTAGPIFAISRVRLGGCVHSHRLHNASGIALLYRLALALSQSLFGRAAASLAGDTEFISSHARKQRSKCTTAAEDRNCNDSGQLHATRYTQSYNSEQGEIRTNMGVRFIRAESRRARQNGARFTCRMGQVPIDTASFTYTRVCARNRRRCRDSSRGHIAAQSRRDDGVFIATHFRRSQRPQQRCLHDAPLKLDHQIPQRSHEIRSAAIYKNAEVPAKIRKSCLLLFTRQMAEMWAFASRRCVACTGFRQGTHLPKRCENCRQVPHQQTACACHLRETPLRLRRFARCRRRCVCRTRGRWKHSKQDQGPAMVTKCCSIVVTNQAYNHPTSSPPIANTMFSDSTTITTIGMPCHHQRPRSSNACVRTRIFRRVLSLHQVFSWSSHHYNSQTRYYNNRNTNSQSTHCHCHFADKSLLPTWYAYRALLYSKLLQLSLRIIQFSTSHVSAQFLPH